MFRKSALSLALSCAAALPAAAQDDDTRTVKGSLGYLQRIALPDEAQAHVVAEGRFGATLGETVLDPDGRQVPLPFEMTVPADLAGTLGAVIRIENRARWLIEGVNFPAGRDTVDLGELTLSPVTPLAFATDFVCGDTPVSVGVLDDEMVMRAEDRDIRLEQVRAASGARYEAVSEPGTSVWNKGEEISVTLNGRDLPDCVRVTPAAMEPYRARGNEPGWHVALDGDTARVVADYGEIELETERPEVAVVPGAYVFDMPGIDASLRIEEGLCHDDATGMPYPDAARLTLGTRELRGCGGDPADLLTRRDVADHGARRCGADRARAPVAQLFRAGPRGGQQRLQPAHRRVQAHRGGAELRADGQHDDGLRGRDHGAGAQDARRAGAGPALRCHRGGHAAPHRRERGFGADRGAAPLTLAPGSKRPGRDFRPGASAPVMSVADQLTLSDSITS